MIISVLSGEPARNAENTEAIIRILLVDDHPIVREGLAAIIQRRHDMQVIAEVGNGNDAVSAYRQHKPELTLMDLRLPGMDGVSAIEVIHAEFPRARFLVLTTFEGDEDIYRALRAGASGYVLKGMPKDELLSAIRAVHAGQRWLPPEIAHKLGERITGQELSAREREVLQLIAAGKSNHEIGKLLFITEGTVKSHVNTLLTKLEARDRTQAVTIALRRGILHIAP